MHVVLASASARRRELLARLVAGFTVVPSDIDETLDAGPLAPAITRLAERKARTVAERAHDAVVLGADTMVVVDDEALGKPADLADAAAMLRRLRGRAHDVVTGVAVVSPDGALRSGVAVTRVLMAPLSDDLIARYSGSGATLDKAGGYAVQDLEGRLVDAIVGSYSNVVGLPLGLTAALLSAAGVALSDPTWL